MQKARCQATKALQPLVSTRFQVLFHSLIQGSFHLSLTVLVHYRSLSSIQPQQMVLLDSDRASPTPPYSGYCYVYSTFLIRGYHPLWPTFPSCSNIYYKSMLQSYNPKDARIPGLGSFPFARHYLGNHYCFLFLSLLRCFSSGGSPHAFA